uniref:ERO1-like protein beta n=1 Tax=Lygus hesperus TaxID=30085 RepID=A0A0A9WP52_LYGHE
MHLQGYAFTPAHRTQLLRDLKDVVIPQKCQSKRAQVGFDTWARYIDAQKTATNETLPVSRSIDLLIDGANVGYYGLSKWYADAKRALLLRSPSHNTSHKKYKDDAEIHVS